MLVVKQVVILHIDSKATVRILSYFGHCINTWYSSLTLSQDSQSLSLTGMQLIPYLQVSI